mmetsp:Transcript_12948/g.15185  ORF Transcript_12948/g.15185 Transcript_12948/m.15185 type:complete len:84 (+) Transcript_12948:392-643(+)
MISTCAGVRPQVRVVGAGDTNPVGVVGGGWFGGGQRWVGGTRVVGPVVGGFCVGSGAGGCEGGKRRASRCRLFISLFPCICGR